MALPGTVMVDIGLQVTPLCEGCIELSSPNMMTGLMIGMVLMMLAPFLVIFGIGGGIFRAQRRALAEAEEHKAQGGESGI